LHVGNGPLIGWKIDGGWIWGGFARFSDDDTIGVARVAFGEVDWNGDGWWWLLTGRGCEKEAGW